MRQLVVFLAVLTLAGCISPNRGRPLDYGEFPSTEYQALATYGTAHVSGRAFAKNRAGSIKPAAGQEVSLIPATDYMKPLFQAYTEQRPITAPDPRARAYTRQVRADSNGNFSFVQVPAGRYYLTCQVNWEVSGTSGPSTVGVFVLSTLTVREGEKVEVQLTR